MQRRDPCDTPRAVVSWQERYLDRYYRQRPGWINGTAEFHEMCAAHLPRGGRFLEIGAGPSNPTSRFLAGLGELHGVDPDPAVRENDALKSAAAISDDRYPFESAWFDGAVSNYVAEHVTDPAAHLREVRRILKPGAPYLLRTPNRYHYVALVSGLTPHWFHRLIANRLRALDAEAHDPYPTAYRMNTESALRALARRDGFEVDEIRLVEKEPSYGMASPLLFFAGLLYERTVNASERLRGLRANLLVALRAYSR
jgi:SAM-dependent methyltransferase